MRNKLMIEGYVQRNFDYDGTDFNIISDNTIDSLIGIINDLAFKNVDAQDCNAKSAKRYRITIEELSK